jgi:hypothetical protein
MKKLVRLLGKLENFTRTIIILGYPLVLWGFVIWGVANYGV